MKKKIFTRLLLILLLFLVVYNFWAETGRARNKVTGWVTMPQINTHFEVIDKGPDSGKMQLLGIQPYLTARSYSTEFNVYVTLRLYLEQLKNNHQLDSPAVVFFPGDIGTWLLLTYEKESVYGAASFEDCLSTMEQSNFYSFASHYISAGSGSDRSLRALVNMKATGMAEMYQRIFSGLAHEFGVTVVAGSILLPSPRLHQGKIQTSRGDLSQVCAVFGPDGALIPPLAIWPGPGRGEAVSKPDTGWPLRIGSLQIRINPFCDHPDHIAPGSHQPALLLMPLAGGKVPGVPACPNGQDSADAGHWRVGAGMALAMNGDLWDRPQRGKALIWTDTCEQLPAPGRKGRIISLRLP